jgi:transposase
MASLSKEQERRVHQLRDGGKTRRIRNRADAILLSYSGKGMQAIAEVHQVDRNTVSNWLNRWETAGIDGLADQPHTEAPPKLDESDQGRGVRGGRSRFSFSATPDSALKQEKAVWRHLEALTGRI